MARGSIRQRSKKRQDSWTVQVYKGRDPQTGKKKYHSEAVKGTKAVAERRLTEILREMDTGSFVAPTGLTVGEYLDEWLEVECPKRVRGVTVKTYEAVVRLYIKPLVGNVRLEQLKASDVRGMESVLLSRGGVRSGQGLASSNVERVHKVFSSAMNCAVRSGLVGTNVVSLVSPPKGGKVERRVLSWDELGALLEELEGDELKEVVIVAIQTGLRRSEVGGLQWRDVDLERRSLSVRRGLVMGLDGYELAPPKNGLARVVTLPDVAVAVFEMLRQRSEYVGSGDFVFCRPDGGYADIYGWTMRFPTFCQKAGIEGMRFHDLRHSHASLMLADGVHLKVVSERLGHSDIRITADLYSHVAPTVQQEASDRFGASWKAGLDPKWGFETHGGS